MTHPRLHCSHPRLHCFVSSHQVVTKSPCFTLQNKCNLQKLRLAWLALADGQLVVEVIKLVVLFCVFFSVSRHENGWTIQPLQPEHDFAISYHNAIDLLSSDVGRVCFRRRVRVRVFLTSNPRVRVRVRVSHF